MLVLLLLKRREEKRRCKSSLLVAHTCLVLCRRPVTPRRIESIQFATLSSAEIIRVSELQVTERNLYKIPSRNPAGHGILDRRMGTTDKSAECHTCGNKMLDCAGEKMEGGGYHCLSDRKTAGLACLLELNRGGQGTLATLSLSFQCFISDTLKM